MKTFGNFLLTLQSGIPTVYDGSTSYAASGIVLDDYETYDGWVYGVRRNAGEVWRRKDFTSAGSWSLFETGAPSNSISIAIHDDYIYVGTKDSKVYKSDREISDVAAIIPPIITLMLDDESS